MGGVSENHGRDHSVGGGGCHCALLSKGKRGCLPIGIEKKLRMYLFQVWFNLSAPVAKDAIYDSCAMRKFKCILCGRVSMIEGQLKKRKNFIDKLMVVIVGMLSCSNIVSVFVVGNSSIPWLTVLAIVFLLICIIRNRGKIINLLHYITKDFWFTGFVIFISIIPVLLLNLGDIYKWFVGIINVFFNFCIIIFIIEEKDYKGYLYIGIAIGLGINFILSVYTMFLYNHGVIFDLASYFPNTSGIGQMQLSNTYRARGLFKEQGHMMRYLAIVSLPVLNYLRERSKPGYFLLLGVVVFLAAFSSSSSLAIFVAGVVTYFFLKSVRNRFKISGVALSVIFIIIFALYLGSVIPFFSRLLETFQKGVLSIFDFQGDNRNRVKGMQYTINIIKEYPIMGCGWNLLTKIFIDHGYYSDAIRGSYSAGLSLIAELGIGSFFYFYFAISKAVSLIRYRYNDECLAVGISLLIYLLIFLSTDYTLDPGSATFLAIVFIVFTDMRDRKKEGNK